LFRYLALAGILEKECKQLKQSKKPPYISWDDFARLGTLCNLKEEDKLIR